MSRMDFMESAMFNRLKPLNQQFSFERSAVRLEDGSWFQPLREGKRCWASYGLASFGFLGESYDALYELKDGTWVLLQFLAPPVKRGEPPRQITECVDVSGRRVDSRFAAEFLADGQFEIPPQLLQELSCPLETAVDEPVAEVRPLSFWDSPGKLAFVQGSAHEVSVVELLDEIRDTGTAAVQEIRRWSTEDPTTRKHGATVALATRLRDRYRVTAKQWWGSESSVPPETVDILQLQWPDGIEEIRKTVLPELRSRVVNAGILFHANPPVGGSAPRPTKGEYRAAEDCLIESLPVIDGLVVQLGAAVDELLAGKVYKRLCSDPETRLRCPKEWELQVFSDSTFRGLTFSEIRKERKIAKNVSSLSRAAARVRDWLGRGNLLPPEYLQKRTSVGPIASMDPSVLDLGANQQGRSHRQRGRKADQ